MSWSSRCGAAHVLIWRSRAVVRTANGAVELLAGRREIEGSDDEEELDPAALAALVAGIGI